MAEPENKGPSVESITRAIVNVSYKMVVDNERVMSERERMIAGRWHLNRATTLNPLVTLIIVGGWCFGIGGWFALILIVASHGW